MTRETASIILENISIFQDPDSNYRKALDIAIKALEKIDKIKQIIAIDNTVIQDVLKYKMICEVMYERYNKTAIG